MKKNYLETGSQVTKLTWDKQIYKDKRIVPITTKYQNVNHNEMNFVGMITLAAENRRTRKKFTTLHTKWEDLKPLLSMDWLRQFYWTMQKLKAQQKQLTNQKKIE